jgi:hypothetical protein
MLHCIYYLVEGVYQPVLRLLDVLKVELGVDDLKPGAMTGGRWQVTGDR